MCMTLPQVSPQGLKLKLLNSVIKKGLSMEESINKIVNSYLEEEQEKQLKNLISNMKKKINKNFKKEKDLFNPIFEEMKRMVLND